MSQQIIIEGDVVRLVQITTERTASLAEWLPKVEKRVPVHTPVLPTATRGLWYDPTVSDDHKMVILMEVPPCVTTIRKDNSRYQLAIPWTRFVFFCSSRGDESNMTWRMEDYRVFWAQKRYSNPAAADMIRALVPNVYGDGRICFGSTGVDGTLPIADRLDQTVNEFYASTFNNDLGIPYPGGYGGFRQWQTASRRDPLVWMNWDDWTHGGYSLYSFNDMTRGYSEDQIHRTDPVMSPNGIPELDLGATFGRVTEWLQGLTPAQRTRIRIAMEDLPATEATEEDPDDDEDDDEDEDGFLDEDEDGEIR